MTWGLYPSDNETHIIPTDEINKHHLTKTCLCNAICDDECQYLVIHNSFDGREFNEKDVMHAPI